MYCMFQIGSGAEVFVAMLNEFLRIEKIRNNGKETPKKTIVKTLCSAVREREYFYLPIHLSVVLHPKLSNYIIKAY